MNLLNLAYMISLCHCMKAYYHNTKCRSLLQKGQVTVQQNTSTRLC